MTALDEILDLQESTLRPSDPPDDGNLPESTWTIADESAATWALLKIRQARETAMRRNVPALELIAEHEAAIAELRRVVDANDRLAQSTVDHFTSLLTDWHRRVLDDDPAAKTIELAAGTLKSRAMPDKVTVTDPDAVHAWAVANGYDEVSRLEPKVDGRALRKAVKDAPAIPGVTVTPRPRKFEVDL